MRSACCFCHTVSQSKSRSKSVEGDEHVGEVEEEVGGEKGGRRKGVAKGGQKGSEVNIASQKEQEEGNEEDLLTRSISEADLR